MSDGHRWEFRPDALATVLTLGGLLVLGSLGTWQLRRKAEMERLDANAAEQLALPPVTSAEIARTGYPAGDRRRVNLVGAFDATRIQLVRGQYFRGEIGYRVVMPFRPNGAAAGLLVDRGWVPRENAAETIRQLRQAEPPTAAVEGLARQAGPSQSLAQTPPSEFDPSGVPIWTRLDVVSMSGSATDITRSQYVVAGPRIDDPYGSAEPASPDRLPIGGYAASPSHRPHLQYALTWYSLGLTLLGVYIGRFLKRSRSQ